MRPPKSNRLIEQLDLDSVRAAARRKRNGVSNTVPGGAEIGILPGSAIDADLRVGGCLIETARQKPVVLEILRGRQQPGGWGVARVAENGLVDLHLVRPGDRLIVRLEL